ncbi:MAG: element excision factor XisH family protein [Geitlerinemataceae cyanobacterium]
MPRRDLYHDTVRNALIKDGRTIADDPLVLGERDLTVFADLGAEKTILAQRNTEKIAVEIKVFGTASDITELQKAIGQYGLYRYLLTCEEPDRKIYLAIPKRAYTSLTSKAQVKGWLQHEQIDLIVFDPNTEALQWIDSWLRALHKYICPEAANEG